VLELTIDDAPFRGVLEGQQSPPVTVNVRTTGDQLINLTGVAACPPRFAVTNAPAGITTLPPSGSSTSSW
jgi:hypothetical protein